jgi:hypothetical protein
MNNPEDSFYSPFDEMTDSEISQVMEKRFPCAYTKLSAEEKTRKFIELLENPEKFDYYMCIWEDFQRKGLKPTHITSFYLPSGEGLDAEE